jgi:uncharacterized protein YndB with AHSA1/START domain
MIDVTQQINAVRRTVGTRVLEAGEARVVTISQVYRAELDDVWDACTNPERIPRWFLPVTGDLREGGHFQLEGNASGTILRCEPPHSFAATWEFGGNTSWIEVRLGPEADGHTRFELEHVALLDEHWAEFGPGAAGVGWEGACMGLALHLSGGQTLDPQQAVEWMGSEDGKRFMAMSSQRWAEADIAAGADPDAAKQAAERTTAFYTGEASGG